MLDMGHERGMCDELDLLKGGLVIFLAVISAKDSFNSCLGHAIHWIDRLETRIT